MFSLSKAKVFEELYASLQADFNIKNDRGFNKYFGIEIDLTLYFTL